MPQPGLYRDRVTFQTEASVSDGGGGASTSWADVKTVSGRLIVGKGREAVAGGQIQSQVGAVLLVRYSTLIAGITAGDRAVIKSVEYNIRSVTQPDRRNKELEFVLERGGAT